MDRIITDIDKLKTHCELISCPIEAKEIADELFKVLAKTDNAIGLAANQIGIDKSVCVVNVTRPLWFANPIYIGGFDKILYKESCLSFPDSEIQTIRYKNIFVLADNLNEEMAFGPQNILECVCVQHEICHLSGETMFDHEYTKTDKQ